MRCPFCGSNLVLESYDNAWVGDGYAQTLTYYCEGCGREFDKPAYDLIPRPFPQPNNKQSLGIR